MDSFKTPFCFTKYQLFFHNDFNTTFHFSNTRKHYSNVYLYCKTKEGNTITRVFRVSNYPRYCKKLIFNKIYVCFNKHQM